MRTPREVRSIGEAGYAADWSGFAVFVSRAALTHALEMLTLSSVPRQAESLRAWSRVAAWWLASRVVLPAWLRWASLVLQARASPALPQVAQRLSCHPFWPEPVREAALVVEP